MRDLSEIRKINNNDQTYTLVRFYECGDREVQQRGMSLDTVQAHCNSADSKGEGWFDGYEVEG